MRSIKNVLIKIIRGVLHILYIFPVKNNKIFFLNSKETGYGYDGKALTEYLTNHFSSQFEIVWGYYDKSKFDGFDLKSIKLINVKSLVGAYHMMTSEAFIYNVNAPLYIPYRDNQLLFNTWHGNPYKKIGKDAADFFDKNQVNNTTYYLSHSKRYDEILRNAFEYEGEIMKCGVPRNDVLLRDDYSTKQSIKMKILGCEDVSIVMYAPTYRKDLTINNTVDSDALVNTLIRKFGGKWIVFVRMHPKVKVVECNSSTQLNMSHYPDMQDLLLVSDVLITDYSSTIWDYSLTRKPVFLFSPDIDDYVNSRGLYSDYFELPFSIATSEQELLDNILNHDIQKYTYNLDNFFSSQGSYEKGKACEEIVRKITNHCM